MAQSPQSLARSAMARHARGVRVTHRLIWYGDEMVRGVDHTFTQRLRTVGTLLRDKIRADIAIPIGFTIGPKGGIIVTQRSKPGQPPRTQIPLPEGGMLLRSIFFAMVSADHVRIGSSMDYSIFLEFGTRRMAARPFMIPAFLKALPQLQRVFGAKILTLRGVPQVPGHWTP